MKVLSNQAKKDNKNLVGESHYLALDTRQRETNRGLPKDAAPLIILRSYIHCSEQIALYMFIVHPPNLPQENKVKLDEYNIIKEGMRERGQNAKRLRKSICLDEDN